MSKSVLISIKPEWCELIESGKKTIEVRKTKPKLETPFKCYIYCTKGNVDSSFYCGLDGIKNGRIIGEFVCDRIHRIAIIDDECVDVVDCNTSCLSSRDILNYANGNPLYGWHISDLAIYDKPKELSEFEKPCPYDGDCWKCKFYDGGSREELPSCNWEDFELTKPPQSWCYVEEAK